LQKCLWNIDIDEFVNELEQPSIFSKEYQQDLKNLFKLVTQSVNITLSGDQKNIAIINDILLADKILNLVLFCFTYNYYLNKEKFFFVFCEEGANIYCEGVKFQNYEFEILNLLANS
jgi:uncharacterized protein VirK/YbjX